MASLGSIRRHQKTILVGCAAAPGSTFLGAVALPLATSTLRVSATATSAFGLSVLLPGLRSPLLFCPLPYFFTLLFRSEQSESAGRFNRE